MTNKMIINKIMITITRSLPANFANGFLLLALSLHAVAQTYTFSEWATPTTGSQPLHVLSASPTQFYFTESAKNRIGGLNISDPLNNSITEWQLLPGNLPHGLVLDANSNLAFCAVGGDYMGVLNPGNSMLTVYPVPTPKGGSIHLDTTVSGAGAPIYFVSESTGNKIAMVDPSSPTQFTEWAIPTANSNPRGVSIGPPDGPGWQVYFIELNAHKIGMLDTFTNQITEWYLPKIRQAEHIHFVPNSSGIGGLVYFGDLADSYVGTLNPGTATTSMESLWTAPAPNAGVADVFVAQGSDPQVYFSERTASQIGFLDSALAAATMVPIPKKDVTVSAPIVPITNSVTPKPYNLKPKVFPVTPSVNNVAGVSSGGYTEWPIPTPNSGPLGVAGFGAGSIIFAEFNTGKIGIMAPSGQ